MTIDTDGAGRSLTSVIVYRELQDRLCCIKSEQIGIGKVLGQREAAAQSIGDKLD
jgi:hypothetical protein